MEKNSRLFVKLENFQGGRETWRGCRGDREGEELGNGKYVLK